MKLFSEILGRLLEKLQSVEACLGMCQRSILCQRLWKRFCCDSKVNIVSKVLVVVKLNLVVVPKMKGVSKLKM